MAVFSLKAVVEASAKLAEARSDSPAPDAPDRIAWAVDAASGRLGGRCLLRSVALQALLARRGVASEICIGFREGENPIPGHAWVEVAARPLGADGAALASRPFERYEVLLRLPDRAASGAPNGAA